MTATEIPQQRFGHYDVERILGRGAMGMVYLARDRRIGRRVALKTIALTAKHFDDSTSPQDFYRRLQREAEVSGSLVHPNIVTLYEAGYEGDRISYLAMEYIEGETLLQLMNAVAPSPLDLETTLRIIEDVLQGLAYAHAAGIIHRDIKPANILITSTATAKIADFGIARPQSSSMTAAGALMGTPNYMSPEQVQGQTLTPKADVFSTGVMLFEMLTAVKPFAAGDLTGTLHNILRQPVPHASELNPQVPRSVGDVVARMVEKTPERRSDASEALADIRRLRAPAIAPRRHAPPRRIPWVRLAIATVALVVAIVAARIAVSRSARPTVVIAPAQIREFEEKRRALEEADAAFKAGKYQESLDRYNAYLQKYPTSAAAIEGRDRARDALTPTPAKTTKHRKRPSREDRDISPSELLSRIKKAIRGH
ncbi:MAG TPA: serine/threonine-protein kinase [Thermoanaerobaculia bacterium]|jgi:serine/threonine-protein kinase|nr:serine/threonine-protein kinase [Thermoanaerobaculia bacterium]